MPGVAELVEQQRQKRRAQLDKILAGGQPQSAPLNFQPVAMPQAQGSNILGWLLGPLSGTAPAQNVPAGTPSISTSSVVFNPQSVADNPAAGTPGGKPLSPPKPSEPPTALQKTTDYLKNVLKQSELYKAYAAIFG